VLGNLATLLDVDARELADWFWIAYMDAWDWVVEPNVMAMATYGAGGVMTTKPYVAGSAYIDRMSDYCQGCAFRPDKDCPVTPLYWAFLERHEPRLKSNPRLKLALASMRKRPEDRRARDRATFVHVREVLANGQPLRPAGALPLG
jgi:deoxyribodipyrimidine photolyase-related protein